MKIRDQSVHSIPLSHTTTILKERRRRRDLAFLLFGSILHHPSKGKRV